jgi:hypothetical protein
MAYAILKGLGAPREVSSATIDASAAKATAGTGCTISNVTGSPQRLEFDRLDNGLPFNRGLFFNLNFFAIPLPDEMNRYLLKVSGLKPGKYTIDVDERALGTFTAEQLTAGVNLASATADPWQPGGPWDAQAWALNYLTEARNETVMIDKLQNQYLKGNPNRDAVMKQIAELNDRIESAQRSVARPQKYHFVISPAKSPTTAPSQAPSAR